MLDLYQSEKLIEDDFIELPYVASFSLEEAKELDRLKTSNSEKILDMHFFEDQFFSEEVVKDSLERAYKVLEEKQKIPGFKSATLEKTISLLEEVSRKRLGIQTRCY